MPGGVPTPGSHAHARPPVGSSAPPPERAPPVQGPSRCHCRWGGCRCGDLLLGVAEGAAIVEAIAVGEGVAVGSRRRWVGPLSSGSHGIGGPAMDEDRMVEKKHARGWLREDLGSLAGWPNRNE
jgi:hypothetical protein